MESTILSIQWTSFYLNNYKTIDVVAQKSYFLVSTTTKKEGVINKSGDLIVDTVFQQIVPLENYFIVSGFGENEEGIIDSLGNWMIEFGKYSNIQHLGNGYIQAYLMDSNFLEAVIDVQGNVLFVVPETMFTWYNTFSPDALTVNLSDFQETSSIYIVVDKKGNKVQFSNKDWIYVIGFKQNKAFALDKNRRWHLIDNQGNIISQNSFSEIEMVPENENYDFILGKIENIWGRIDTLGNFEALNNVDKFYYYCTDSIQLKHTESQQPFQYVDQNGKVIWKGKKVLLKDLNIDFMMMSFYDVVPQKSNYLNKKSKGISEKLESKETIQVFIDTSQLSNWNGFDGYKIYVANRTVDTASFATHDGLLFLQLEALDENGNWRAIEYMYNSGCGNSYFRKPLKPNQYWVFDTPKFQGGYKTKIRAVVNFITIPKGNEKSITLYSNEIDGYINPGQFWSKKERSNINLFELFE